MSQTLQKLREVDPNDSDAVKEAISGFIQDLLKHTSVNSNSWLRTVDDVINRFPRHCAQHRNTIEKFLVHFLDSSSYFNVIEAAKCAHSLQQIRPSQDKMATPKNCWREQMFLLCNTAHNLIEAIFSNTVAIYKNNNVVKKSGSELLGNTPLTTAFSRILNVEKHSTGDTKRAGLVNKLRNILVFIQAMLVEVYPVGKPIQPQLILELIVPALNLSSSANTDPAEASIVKIQALRTLDALIACLGKNLIPFSALVIRIVMQTLRWSIEHNNEESRKVRCAAYKSLSLWLSTLHAHCVTSDGRDRCWEDELSAIIAADITTPKKIVQLTMNKIPTKNLSKKAKRKLANQQLDQSALTKYAPGEKNKEEMPSEQREEIAIAALECAEMFLTVCGIFLKQSTHKLFHERLVRECFSAERARPRVLLRQLRALGAARRHPPPQLAPPTHYCLQLYTMLLNHTDAQIRKFCSQALLDIRLQLHCSPPSLNFALEVSSETRQPKNKLQAASKKNRAALIKLLGADKVPPPPSDEEEEESAGEGPSTKKRRLTVDEPDTRISISSDSTESSVVISDDSGSEIEEVVEVNNTEDNDVVMLPSKTETPRADSASNTDITIRDKLKQPAQMVLLIVPGKPKQPQRATSDVPIPDEQSTSQTPKPAENASPSTPKPAEKATSVGAKLAVLASPSKPISVEQASPNKLNSKDKPAQMPTPRKSKLGVMASPSKFKTIDITSTTVSNSTDIHEVETQVALNTSTDTTDGEKSPARSMEVAYDLPRTPKKVTFPELAADDNLPSTSESDDVQITCGQPVNSSPETKKENSVITKEVPVIVPPIKSPSKAVQEKDKASEATNGTKQVNGEGDKEKADIEVKITSTEVSVDAMMADFVDEVCDDPKLVT
ncbi:proline-, glutamic acid- and leucine-rich protein 1-like isoform X2 [Trichoplusia ni]|uniref:Proline-, glutamic acid- and leucine-rich protein 1-like isoform X2 n=1 Tax=Trichoplusia ni TaxID=7111 RepID=A0A7E5VY28_TRINI|nr:proline-, glutamic acid- and leucine-rich protein 1-like isoform X2 [Trichoplusia ni]